MAIDPSSNLGWAHGEIGGRPIYGTQKLPKVKLTQKAIAMEGFLLGMIKGNGITRLYVERPILPRVTSFDSMMSMGGLALAIGMTAQRAGADMIFVDQQTWRKDFMGVTQAPKMSDTQIMGLLVDVSDPDAVRRYNATLTEDNVKKRRSEARRRWLKAYTMEQCRKAGYPVDDDNAADAIGIWKAVEKALMKRESRPEADLLAGLEM